MATRRTKRAAKPSPEGSRRESGLPGGGQGRIDTVGHSGIYPGSGPYPSGPAELRTPAEFVHGQTDAEGRPVEGGSELIYFGGQTLLGGATPSSSAPPAAPEPQVAEGMAPRRRKTGGTRPRARRPRPAAGRETIAGPPAKSTERAEEDES